MNLSQLITIVSTLYLLHHLAFTMAGNSPTPSHPVDDVVLNCGSSGISTALDGREWIGDIGSKFISSKQPKAKSVSSRAVHQYLSADPVPYITARISRSQFTYTFEVRPGQKFIRLHFHPTSYMGFKKSKAFFTVKADRYTILSNFSASLAADALGVKYFAKEFCVTIKQNRALSISFSPSPSTSEDVYAFINGIEIVSMPSGLYYSRDGELGARVVGNNYHFYIDNSTALEMVHRLNIGGRSILSVEDLGMFRLWSEDKKYLLESGVVSISTTGMIKYTNIQAYTAPLKLYQTTWSMVPNKHTNQMHNFTWKLPVDLGFRYLVRLHFCETEHSRKEFGLFINNEIAEAYADVVEWSGETGVAVYRDYVLTMEGDRMEGKRDLIIVLQPKHDSSSKQTGGILNGLEILKLSNPDNNLAGPNPVSVEHSPNSWTPKLLFAFGSGNSIATGMVVILTLLNIIVYQLNLWRANSREKNTSISSSEELCRCFSFAEIQLATNNFDDMLVIGKGGFGKVYKGLIDDDTKTVAIKRLNSESKQGAREFWTEVETLSKLRHIHLVSLIGYCNECQEMLLVYEYMAHGTLADHLYNTATNGSGHLTWEQRLNTCIGSARGLDYLHRGRGAGHRIIHRDVKSTNILLDENWVAKISDFGLSKMNATNISRSHITTNVKGTFGYLDPEYFLSHRLTTKSDVYAFGVVLFEVLCGRPAVDIRLAEEQHSLALWAQHCITEGELDQIVDPSLMGQISPHCLKVFADIAHKCLHNDPNKRPTMAEVVASLDFALEKQGRADYYTDHEEVISNVGENFNKQIIPLMGDALPTTSGSGNYRGETKSKVLQIRTNEGRGLGKMEDYVSNRGPSRGGFWDSIWTNFRTFRTKAFPLPPTTSLPPRRFSHAEIRAATKGFSKVIRNLPECMVCMGKMDDGTNVAVKYFNSSINYETIQEQFCTEIRRHSQLQCINLVSLIGYSDERGMILVYDYMANGDLYDHLHSTNDDPISWKQRIHICIDAARGLNYLHTGTKQRVVHGNVNLFNIQLDEKWVAKISGLGWSKLCPQRESFSKLNILVGAGYMDPEYRLTGTVTEKSDVFSFGIVLFQVLSGTGRKESQEEQREIYEWAKKCVNAGTVYQIIDPCLIRKISPPSLSVFVEIVYKCLRNSSKERPQMTDVMHGLERALELQEIADAAAVDEEQTFRLSDTEFTWTMD